MNSAGSGDFDPGGPCNSTTAPETGLPSGLVTLTTNEAAAATPVQTLNPSITVAPDSPSSQAIPARTVAQGLNFAP